MSMENKTKTILVTGGAGYIGSHCVFALLEKGFRVAVFDNLSTGHLEIIKTLKKYDSLDFYKVDLCDDKKLEEAFNKVGHIDAVIHFAAYSQVAESVQNPQKYYKNNLIGSLNLFGQMLNNNIYKLVFSSTAATYGNPVFTPITENHPQNPINTYGKTKLFIENILKDYDKAYGLKSIKLRYFNVAGANSKGIIGEWHEPETHLIPNVLRSALGMQKEFCLFGTDYDTKDGTCVRDYVNVEDLIDAHLLALENLLSGGNSDEINLGTDEGSSVKEVFSACENATGKKIPLKICERREGDPPILIADNQKAKQVLNWTPKRTLQNSVESAYNWQNELFQGKFGNKKKLTIGIFNDSFYPMADGVISVVDNYARRLAKYAKVIVFVPKYFHKKYDDSQLPYKVVRCRSLNVPKMDYSLPLPKLDKKFLVRLNKYKLDIVHIHSPFTVGRAGLKYAINHNIPCVATMHTQFKQDFQKVVKFDRVAKRLNNQLIKLFNKCDECWAVNKEVARIYYEDYKYKCMPRVMNNATEMLLVDKKEAFETINELYNLKPDEKVFLFVGRINTLKNILFIADSIAKLKTLKPNFKFKMLYVGSGQDEDKLKERIKNLGIENETIMCGKITDRKLLAQHYSRADLMLFPSAYDASSIVQIEAASQKTPVVFLKNTATACMIEDDFNGYLSDFDVDAYAQKIFDIMKNEKLRKQVSENAFNTIYKTWDNAVDEAFAIYKELIDKKQLEMQEE